MEKATQKNREEQTELPEAEKIGKEIRGVARKMSEANEMIIEGKRQREDLEPLLVAEIKKKSKRKESRFPGSDSMKSQNTKQGKESGSKERIRATDSVAKESKCRSCGRPVLWEMIGGRWHIVDARPTTFYVPTAAGLHPQRGHLNHIVTCPHRDEHRKERPGRE